MIVNAWQINPKLRISVLKSPLSASILHGESSCFLPLAQLDQDYYAPRIIQIAGSYPGITAEEIQAVSSEPSPDMGQWNYDFSDPDGPQLGTIAIEGSDKVHNVDDPVVIIAEHQALGVTLPPELEDPVDLIVLVDRARQTFAERKFLVLELPGENVSIGAYTSKSELPTNCNILGQVALVQIPWLPCMKKTKTGFMEEDEYF
eukprot:CAMPEP_0194135638 /NCGR_PEP_ID=MMETSP0152-20130528/5745_1 /TAXON_ID=1049557 /ORGANISM="Thalassiothrix antarctica, Strain L6-D1" /LENGTH=202 /DNA_ID=CAMNT_0038831975 /DNA_START=129 /DNA_END=737 /DNA_ORIENTATION=+